MKLSRILLLAVSALITTAVLAQTPQQDAIKKQAELVQYQLQHDTDALDRLQEFKDYLQHRGQLENLVQQYQAAAKPAAKPEEKKPATPAAPAPAKPAPTTPQPAASSPPK